MKNIVFGIFALVMSLGFARTGRLGNAKNFDFKA